MAYIDDLREELKSPIYQAFITANGGLVDRTAAAKLAAMLNAPAVTSEDNPDPQGTVTRVPEGIDVILDEIDDTEFGKVWATPFNQMMEAAGTGAPTEARALSRWMNESREDFNITGPVADVGQKILQSKDVEAVKNLISVMVAAGTLDAQSAANLQLSLEIPDPDWQPTIWTFGPSVNDQKFHRESVTVDDVTQALG